MASTLARACCAELTQATHVHLIGVHSDVPGMTQAVIPWLLANGVGGVTVGVNSASSPPDVPEAFVWADATGKQSVVAMEHKGGYGWMQGMEPKLTDCALVAPPQAGGKITALCFAFKGDNRGPQNTTEVIADFTAIQVRGGSPLDYTIATHVS